MYVPEITFRVAEWQDKSVLQRLLELYQYDMDEYWPQHLNSHGEYGSIATERYLRNPLLRAYIFLVDGKYAGFGLVDPDVSLADNEFRMGQFFVMRPYRRFGVGKLAAHHIFDQHRGKWEVGQVPLNLPATVFWRTVIGEYTDGNFVDQTIDDEHWHGPIQTFDNRAFSARRRDASEQTPCKVIDLYRGVQAGCEFATKSMPSSRARLARDRATCSR